MKVGDGNEQYVSLEGQKQLDTGEAERDKIKREQKQARTNQVKND